MGKSFDLGVLDLCRVTPGSGHSDRIWETIDIAPKLEQFGYSRYWLAEHHDDGFAQSSPELLVALLAGSTEHMRIGVAGILLRFHSPFKIAKDFRLLHAIFPGRIDLGVARGTSSESVKELLLGKGVEETCYEVKVFDLLTFLRGGGCPAANPIAVKAPDVWLLGSGTVSALFAGRNGTSFCFARFLSRNGHESCREAIAQYRHSFQPSPDLPHPRWCVAVAGVCASSEHIARELAGVHGEVGTAPIQGVIPTLIGNPEQCRSILMQMATEYSTTTFVFLDMCPAADSRSDSYRLLAEALELATP
jgi:luciferase family oxidoreductase group 1